MRWPCASLGWGHFPARTFIIEVITPAFGGSTALGGRASKPSVRIRARCGVKKSCSPPARRAASAGLLRLEIAVLPKAR